MKYYIATSLERAAFHNLVREDLKKFGCEVTYDWTTHGSVKNTSKARLQEVAHLEFQGILESDFVLVLLPGGKGTHAELGFALGCKKRVFIHSEDPMAFEIGPQVCAFYHHADVVRVSCPIADLANALQPLLVSASSI